MRFSDSGWLTVNSASSMETRGVVAKGYLAVATIINDLNDERVDHGRIVINGVVYTPGEHKGRDREQLRDVLDMHMDEIKNHHKLRAEASNARPET